MKLVLVGQLNTGTNLILFVYSELLSAALPELPPV